MLSFKQLIPLLLAAAIALPRTAAAQTGQERRNPIPVAVPVLNVVPDARAAAMGDMAVATSPDINAQHRNPAKYPFMNSKVGVGLSYVPWLRTLVMDVDIAYLTYFNRLDDMQSVSGSIKFFGLGEMAIMDAQGIKLADVRPYEMAMDVAYARKFGNNFSGSLALRYIRSDLTGGHIPVDGNWAALRPANGFGADIGTYYQGRHEDNDFGLGLAITNLGTKMAYSENAERYFLPTNLHLGGSYTFRIDFHNSFMMGLELSKLLVPTPPVREGGTGPITRGKENNVSVVEGLFQSFGDAPFGLREELSEVMWGFGMEYNYLNQFFARGGYFHDSKRKGNRRYMTFGAGIKYTFLSLDFSYLFPFTTNDPLENTLRISLSFDINTTRPAARR